MWRNIVNTYVINLDKIPNLEATKEIIGCHIAHLRKLDQEGCLILAGPFTDYPAGMVIIRAADKEQATKIAESDPFVKEGVRSYNVRTWLLANEENNYLS